MPPKRPSEDLQHSGKIPKIEQGLAQSSIDDHEQHGDFSRSVKKRLANSSRTGQACDRCKVRKIRCDGRPEGCSPCAQNRTPCKTTDRITGRATTRGQVEAMESENAYLRAHISELQAQLKEMGVEPRTPSNYTGYMAPTMSWPPSNLGNDNQGWGDISQRRSSTSPIPGYAPASGLENTDYRPLPHFKTGSIGDNYLGVSSADSLLSHIKGTSLSLFGTEIDITDFVDNEEDYDKSVMSYNHFLKASLNDDAHVHQIPFPPYHTLKEYATWYIRSLNPYTMILDKPTFMHLIWRIGNESSFLPTPAETVCVHMMLATLKYQISVRNGQKELMVESHNHYRVCLSLFKDLLYGHQWQDLQALTLICLHLRNFPKPGAAWLVCSITFLLAIELGLHRSTKAWADAASKMDKLEVEMRKKIFWTLHALTTNLSGKLGRPMPINMDDVDVEFPEPGNDCLPGEDVNLTPFHKCSFQVGIQISKYTVWSSELFRTVYGIRQSSRTYEDSVKRLEGGIQRWKDEIPFELADPARASKDDYIFALYLEFWELEFQLLLHHPAVCRSTDSAFINANLDKCLIASQKMLHNANGMRKIRSLDIPWINAVVYIAAIFTTLFVYFQRKDQMTSVDMTKLKTDMDQWIEVMGDCGQLLDRLWR
ncbi:hypothetical protein K504DRAFT_298521 [Pleomassaria siparia CBS 279.74]|uniref:Zn(2)-C6 fungal-type domain-containing protein n=1 Tax=Pleomassaria siparia CBS 279.74 TaxID=1314801 RepID=A0A6G1K5C6_9PLEO|nr:hypothetical protein K504DRAFT_298521 [Pleomassaria siparia CBS 279.74]